MRSHHHTKVLTSGIPGKTPQITSALGRIAEARKTRAEKLDLGGLGLVEVPTEILELRWLKRLYLGPGRNRGFVLDRIEPNGLNAVPLALFQALTALEVLDLSYNQLASLPPEIATLTSLQALWLNNNKLASLPPEIAALTSLQELRLNNNQLASLPPEIAALTSLQELRLNNNPLVTPPLEVVAQGLHAIRAYLREFRKDARPLYEAKIVLVGEGQIGKTTLKERLIHKQFATPQSTRGLEIEAIERGHPNIPGQKMTLNFWDFGGQEDYRPAQQFFFSRDALYIMVWRADYDAVQSNVEAWMRLIRHRVGPGARVLVVATHADKHTPGDGVRQLCADKFANMAVGFHAVDNTRGNGADELWEAIEREVAKLNDFGAERPKSWIDARDAILARQTDNHQMSFTEFHQLATSKGVADNAVQTFATMLTHQGRIVYHGDDHHLAGIVVLEPEWLMKAIAYVLTDKRIQENNGVLPETSLARIWLNHDRAESEKPIRYKPNHWGHLLRLMDRHDIVYRLTETDWLVGQLVSTAKPQDLPWDGRTHGSHGAPVRMECRIDDHIPGLMALFTVRTHFYHYDFKRFCWRGGVFLRHPYHPDTMALAEADGPMRLRIATTGAFAPNLMERLAGSLEDIIHAMWSGGAAAEDKPYRFIVPCPTEGCPGYFLRDDLFHDLGEGDEEARCNEGRRCKHDIRTLLNGQPTPHRLMRLLQNMDGKLDEVRGGIGNILSYVSNEAPRIYSLRPADKAWDPLRIINTSIEIQIWCEELNRPVPGAVEVVTLDKEWVKHLRAWAPVARMLANLVPVVGKTAVAAGELLVSTEKGLKDLCDNSIKVVDAVEKTIGDGKDQADFAGVGAEHDDPPGRHFALARGQYVAPEVAAALQRAARNGGMTRIQMDDDKRWRWVCPKIANRNDRSVPKE